MTPPPAPAAPSAASASALTAQPRTAPRLLPALGGVWRLTWRRVFAPSRAVMTLVMVVLLGVLTFRFAVRGHGGAYWEWIHNFVLGTVVPILAFLGGAGALREALKPGAVDYLSTRPIPRPLHVLFNYLSQTACGLIAGAVLVLFMAALGAVGGREGLLEQLPRQLVFMSAAVAAFTALGFGMGALTRRYMILGLLYAGLIEAGLGNIPIQINKLSIARHLRVLLDGAGYEPLAWNAATFGALGLLVVISAALVAVAMAIFARKEFLGAREKEA